MRARVPLPTCKDGLLKYRHIRVAIALAGAPALLTVQPSSLDLTIDDVGVAIALVGAGW